MRVCGSEFSAADRYRVSVRLGSQAGCKKVRSLRRG